MKYPFQIKAEAKRLFVDEGKTYRQISDHFGGKPGASCIANWANRAEGGKTWHELRQERAEAIYQRTTPQERAMRLMNQIDQMLADPGMDVKKADTLAKLSKLLEKLVDPKYNVPVMFQMLTEQVEFVVQHYPGLLKAGFAEMMRDFKNHLRGRLESGVGMVR